MIREDGTSTISVIETDIEKFASESESGISVSVSDDRLTIRIGESWLVVPARIAGPLHDLLGRVM